MGDNRRPAVLPARAPLRAPFRLTEEWYRNSVVRLQARLHEDGLDGIILGDVWNIIYFCNDKIKCMLSFPKCPLPPKVEWLV